MNLKPNCFEKNKRAWVIFKKLYPTKLHLEQSAPLAANVGGMVSCRLRGTSVSTDTKLQAGGNASN